jgi:hypothetical protein
MPLLRRLSMDQVLKLAGVVLGSHREWLVPTLAGSLSYVLRDARSS